MFVSRVRSRGKDGRAYVSVLLRESRRAGKKVLSRTLAVLTDLPDWLIQVVESAVKAGKDANSLEQLATSAGSRLGLRCAESFGAIFVVCQIAQRCGIPQALGPSEEARLALWQVCARVLSPATSLLGMIRLAATNLAAGLLGFKEAFNEDDLYQNGAWVAASQAKIEAKLWTASPPSTTTGPESLFFYDVTSSYFEGVQNDLADFGYNRDRVKGKKQVVMGLLTDARGEPVSVSLFPGNTSDLSTFKTQIAALKDTFHQQNITMVGDRGMIRRPQQTEVKEAGFHYISALHKAEIETLLKSGELQMTLFDNLVHEIVMQDGRRLVTRCNPVRRGEMATARQGFRTSMETWLAKANTYLKEHPKAKPDTQLKLGTTRLQRGKLHTWMTLEIKERTLRLLPDEAKLKEHAKLDGCYAIVSDLPEAVADKQTLHDRYKDLAKVESDFRTLKHGHLEIRPWYVRNEDNTRAHALTAMLALKIRRRLARAWEPLNLTVEEGLADLQRLSVMEIYEKSSGALVSRQLPEPSASQAALLHAAGVSLPPKAPAKGPDVVTRVKLQTQRKAGANP